MSPVVAYRYILPPETVQCNRGLEAGLYVKEENQVGVTRDREGRMWNQWCPERQGAMEAASWHEACCPLLGQNGLLHSVTAFDFQTVTDAVSKA